MTLYGKILAAVLALIAGLAVASTVLLTAVSHDKPLHHAYACELAKDFRRDWQLPASPCRTPGHNPMTGDNHHEP